MGGLFSLVKTLPKEIKTIVIIIYENLKTQHYTKGIDKEILALF
jgi:hypothetical protein